MGFLPQIVMKRYIRANSDKPVLKNVQVEWNELDDGSGMKYTIYSSDDEVLFEELFDYQDVDTDAIYDSAADMAITVLSQKFDLTNEVKEALKGG